MRLLPILLLLITSVAECLMLSRVLVPQYKLFGEDALLKCEYDLGRDRLYAVKWYKDNEEFFRYVPRFNPPIYTHPVEGVRVESSKSNDKRVLLRSLTVRSTGVYRCEVSAEAPSFASIMGEGRMTVVYLPKEAPQITGNLRNEYEVGDVLDLNCTSAKSFPPAKLSWYINDSPVDVPWSISLHPAPMDQPVTSPPQYHLYNNMQEQPNLRHSSVSSGTPSSTFHYLMISSLRLQLQLQAHHFGPKGAAVRCVARISPLFWQDGDEKIFGHHGHHGHKNGDKEEIEEEARSYDVTEENDDQEVVGDDHENMDDVEHHRHRYPNKEQQQHHRRHNNNNVRTNHHTPLHYEDEEEEYYGHLPAFQRESLVLVRGGCSTPQLSLFSYCQCLLLLLFLRPHHAANFIN